MYSDTLQSEKKIESVKIKGVKFLIDFLDELGNFKQKKITLLFFILSIFTLCKVSEYINATVVLAPVWCS